MTDQEQLRKLASDLAELADDMLREHENTLCNDPDAEARYVGRARDYRDDLRQLLTDAGLLPEVGP